MTTKRSFPRGLYGITPDWADTARLMQAVTQAHAGGMRVLQWRRKTGTPAEQRAQAVALQAHCRALGVLFLINDDWQLALELDSDGAHLGRDDGSVAQARAQLGPDKLIGCSCYNEPERAAARVRDGVDYIAFGSVYPSPVKPEAQHATLDDLRAGRRIADQAGCALVAIGGITPQNTPALIAAGVDSVAVITALFGAPDVRAAARAFTDLFT